MPDFGQAEDGVKFADVRPGSPADKAGLKAGDIVSTGTCTGIDAIKPGDEVIADFGSLGRVEFACQ